MKRKLVTVRLEPLGRSFQMEPGAPLQEVLAAHGVEFPCGGRGTCAGCLVKVLSGELEIAADQADLLSREELAGGWRLACRSRARGDVVLEVGQWDTVVLTDDREFSFRARPGIGIAVDVGTTTLVAQLVDFPTGRVLAVQTALNPQAAYGADVMSRIDAAVSEGKESLLVGLLRAAVGRLVGDLLAMAGAQSRPLARVVLAGNTAMHHFFCGLDPAPLSAWPFATPAGGPARLRPADLGWSVPGDPPVSFLPWLGGFVGSDLLCGVLAIGLHRRETPCILIDLGTNGEIVVGHRGRILCASTAAGPAFEGGGIGMGMRASTGAVHQVRSENGRLRASVVGGGEARGICGSGLVDAVAAALDLGLVEPSGRLATGGEPLAVASPVVVTQRDIRQLQLAKAAVAAGVRLLRRRFGEAAAGSISVYLAGAFGNYVDLGSARRIGLFGGAHADVRAAGNTALLGAKIALLADDGDDFRSLLEYVEHVALASDPDFEEAFVGEMPFPAGPEAPGALPPTGT